MRSRRRSNGSSACTIRKYVKDILTLEIDEPVVLDWGDTVATPATPSAALHAAGAGVQAARLVLEGQDIVGLLLRAAARPSRRAKPRDGLLHFQQYRRRGRAPRRRGGTRARRDRRLGRPPRKRHREHVHRRRSRALHQPSPVSALPGHGERRDDRERKGTGLHDQSPDGRGRRRPRIPRGVSRPRHSGARRVRAPSSFSSRPASTRTRTIRSPVWSSRPRRSGR